LDNSIFIGDLPHSEADFQHAGSCFCRRKRKLATLHDKIQARQPLETVVQLQSSSWKV